MELARTEIAGRPNERTALRGRRSADADGSPRRRSRTTSGRSARATSRREREGRPDAGPRTQEFGGVKKLDGKAVVDAEAILDFVRDLRSSYPAYVKMIKSNAEKIHPEAGLFKHGKWIEIRIATLAKNHAHNAREIEEAFENLCAGLEDIAQRYNRKDLTAQAAVRELGSLSSRTQLDLKQANDEPHARRLLRGRRSTTRPYAEEDDRSWQTAESSPATRDDLTPFPAARRGLQQPVVPADLECPRGQVRRFGEKRPRRPTRSTGSRERLRCWTRALAVREIEKGYLYLSHEVERAAAPLMKKWSGPAAVSFHGVVSKMHAAVRAQRESLADGPTYAQPVSLQVHNAGVHLGNARHIIKEMGAWYAARSEGGQARHRRAC